MHTIGNRGWRIHFNSDLSGDAVLKKDSVDLTGHGHWTPEVQLKFPAELLLEFQARALESAADEIEGETDEQTVELARWLKDRAMKIRGRAAP